MTAYKPVKAISLHYHVRMKGLTRFTQIYTKPIRARLESAVKPVDAINRSFHTYWSLAELHLLLLAAEVIT